MEVGLVGDYAINLHEFYNGVVRAMGERLTNDFAVALYKTEDAKFQLVKSSGLLSVSHCERFGEGPFSLCAIRSRTIIHPKGDRNRVISPFYEGHHLRGLFMIECPARKYQINEDDLIFINEVTRFIENNHKRYKDLSKKY